MQARGAEEMGLTGGTHCRTRAPATRARPRCSEGDNVSEGGADELCHRGPADACES